MLTFLSISGGKEGGGYPPDVFQRMLICCHIFGCGYPESPDGCSANTFTAHQCRNKIYLIKFFALIYNNCHKTVLLMESNARTQPHEMKFWCRKIEQKVSKIEKAQKAEGTPHPKCLANTFMVPYIDCI